MPAGPWITVARAFFAVRRSARNPGHSRVTALAIGATFVSPVGAHPHDHRHHLGQATAQT